MSRVEKFVRWVFGRHGAKGSLAVVAGFGITVAAAFLIALTATGEIRWAVVAGLAIIGLWIVCWLPLFALAIRYRVPLTPQGETR
jgi:hypothetical protein